MTTDASPRPCLNCGNELQGPFCHRCGQRDQAKRLPLKALFHDVLHDIWHFDHKVLETLRLLVFKPGVLTLAYLEGRRSRYVPPFRLYIFVSFVLFFAFSLVPVGTGKPGASSVNVIVESETGKAEQKPTNTKASPEDEWANNLKARAKATKKNPEGFQRAFLSNLSKSLFLLMPLFAAILHGLYLRRKPLYVDHLILSLHYHTLAFLVILALMGLAALPGEDWGLLPGLALFLAPPIHLAASLRRLHSQGWTKSLIKAALASLVYGAIILAALFGLLLLSLPKA